MFGSSLSKTNLYAISCAERRYVIEQKTYHHVNTNLATKIKLVLPLHGLSALVKR